MGLWTRRRDGHSVSSLVHHSDHGVQYVAVRYTERLLEAGAFASVGSKGDSYDKGAALLEGRQAACGMMLLAYRDSWTRRRSWARWYCQ
jgi:transposase InsO family protein